MSEATPFCSVKGDRLAVWPRRRDSLRRQSRLSRRGSIAASATGGAKLPVRIHGYYLSERKSTMLLIALFLSGGEGGIRTRVPLITATRFPVVLVMTTSILLHILFQLPSQAVSLKRSRVTAICIITDILHSSSTF